MKINEKLVAVAVATSMVVPTIMPIMAEGEQTTLSYNVEESYDWSVPTKITFTSDNTEVITNGTSGDTQNVCVSKNVIANGKSLKIKLKNPTFKIKSDENAELTYGISVKDSSAADYTALSSTDLDVLTVAAGTNTGEATLKFTLTKDSVEKAGTYTGTVTYEASVESNAD